MRAIGIIIWLLVGSISTLFVVIVLQSERVIIAAGNLKQLVNELNALIRERVRLNRKIKQTQQEIASLRESETQLCNERDVLEVAWESQDLALVSTKCVAVEEASIFGRGSGWVYAYTFPAHEELARAQSRQYFPIKVGMSTQENVVQRVHQQVAGNSTAISERAILQLVFRVNKPEEFEKWLHQKLHSAGRRAQEAIGVEWFRTNPLELERLFRSYVLTKSRYRDPIVNCQENNNSSNPSSALDVGE